MEDEDVLADDELPTDGYDLYKNYRDAQEGVNRAFDLGREYERANPTYAHRNGESDDPGVDGFYWVYSKEDDEWYVDRWSNSIGWDTDYGYDPAIIAIHGPIPQPKRA